jgi:ribonuclease HII
MLLSCLQNNRIEAGCDEAGRGCLAGPVFAAAVILPPDYRNDILNDSKKLSEKKRNFLRLQIEDEALAYGVAMIMSSEIDEINILNASIKAMHKALDLLVLKPQHLLIDGNRFKPYLNIPHTCVIKGDGKFLSIAAASILAKTYRDEYMLNLDKQFPEYLWSRNKGYPTKAHREAIKLIGSCEHHRQTFRLLENQLKLDL